MRGWIREVGRVLGRAEVATGHFRLDVLAPGTAARVRPGQFAMVRVGPGPDTVGGGPFLARPLSFFDIDPSRGVISFLVRVVGEGTRALASCRPGDRLLLTGPYGNG
ncbi:MAG: FAD-binding oxidoreductase, partial [Bacillota bacterium]